MRNRTQKVNIPSSGGGTSTLLWTSDDLLVVRKLRKDAERDGIDWRSEILGPSVIQKAVDLLFPGDQKCGQTRAYRIQKLVPVLPEDQKVDLLVTDAVPGGNQKAEALAALDQKALPEDQRASLWSRARWQRADRKPEALEADPEGETSGAPERAWPLLLIAASAFCALWAGWVGLGKMTGFGEFTPLPGLVSWTMDASITLPGGVEALAAYAIRAWLSGYGTAPTRRLAKRAAVGCLILGAAGQVAYHLMKVAGVGADGAPWQVTTLVSIIPIASIGIASGLQHRLAMDRRAHKARLRRVAQNV